MKPEPTGWRAIDPDVRRFIIRTLTYPQFEAFFRHVDGISQQTIARRLGISRRAVRDRLEHAHLRLANAGLRQDSKGRFYFEEAA